MGAGWVAKIGTYACISTIFWYFIMRYDCCSVASSMSVLKDMQVPGGWGRDWIELILRSGKSSSYLNHQIPDSFTLLHLIVTIDTGNLPFVFCYY
jgi:hypothetical protein